MGVRVLPCGYLRKTYTTCLRKKVSFPCYIPYVCGEVEVTNMATTEDRLKLRTAVCKLIIDPYGSQRVLTRERKKMKESAEDS